MALLVLLAFAQPAVVSAGTRAELNAARERLAALRKDYEAAKDRAARINAELQSLIAQISQAIAQKEALDAAIADAKGAIRRSERAAAELQGNLDARARDIYIRGPAGALTLILEADSLLDLSDRASFLQTLSEADANAAAGLQLERRQVAELRKQLTSYQDGVQRLLERLGGKRADLEATFAEASAAQADLDAAMKEQQDAVKKLEERFQRELAAQYGFTLGGTSGPPLRADGPMYWCPIDAPRSYVDTWGAPRSGGRTHEGTDVFSTYGNGIRSPVSGIVREHLDGLGGYTVNITADNGDYFYIAHMAKFAGVDGNRVKPGDLIGFVGESGNAQGTSPHGHVQYSPGGAGNVNPYPYLNEVCGVNGGG